MVLLDAEKPLRDDQSPFQFGLDPSFLEELMDVNSHGLRPVGISEDEWLALVHAFNVLQSYIETPSDYPAIRQSRYGAAFLSLYELLVEATGRS